MDKSHMKMATGGLKTLLNTLSTVNPAWGQVGLVGGGLVTLSSAGLVGGGLVSFYYLYKKYYKNNPLSDIDLKKLAEEKARIHLLLEELEENQNFLKEKKTKLEEHTQKASSLTKMKLETELSTTNMKMQNIEVDSSEFLVRLQFVNTLETLIKRKRFLENTGLWAELDGMLKDKNSKVLKEIDKHFKKQSTSAMTFRNSLAELENKISTHNEQKIRADQTIREESQKKDGVDETSFHEEIDNLIIDGTPEQWQEFLEKIEAKKGSFDLSQYFVGKDISSKPSYRNLLIAIFNSKLSAERMVNLFQNKSANKFTIRAIRLLKALKENEKVDYDPTSSERNDCDIIVSIIGRQKNEVSQIKEPHSSIKQYEFQDLSENKIVITREVERDEAMHAKKVLYYLG